MFKAKLVFFSIMFGIMLYVAFCIYNTFISII